MNYETKWVPNLCSCIAKEMMGGWREMLVNELQVTPLFSCPSLVVTTATGKVAKEGNGKEGRDE